MIFCTVATAKLALLALFNVKNHTFVPVIIGDAPLTPNAFPLLTPF